MLNAHQCRSASDSCGYFTPLLASRPTARILDVGCGPGSITANLASLVPRGEVLGIDYSADAGQRLRYWALQAGFKDERITFSSSPILYSGAEVTRWWGSVQAERFGGGTFKENVVSKGLATDEEVASFGQAWLEWGEQPGAIYSAGCGEVVC